MVLAAPVGLADACDYVETGELHVPAPGVLANDSDADGDPLRAVVETSPANGTLALAADGSFVYTPSAGFGGADSFTYRAVATPLLHFNLVPAESTLTLDATLHTPLGTRSASDSSRVGGYADARLTPPNGSAAQIHIESLHGDLLDGMVLDFNYGFLVGRLTATVNPNELHVDMAQAGPPAAVVAGAFTQTGNTLLATGTAHLVATGLIAGLANVPPTVDINSEFVTDLAGTLTESAGVLRIVTPVDLADVGVPVADGVTIDYHIHGTLVSTVAVPPVEQSPPVTVTLSQHVDATNDYYRVPLGGTLSTSANPPSSESTVFAAGAAWKYLDNGSDQGTAWRERTFDDSAWATGNAQLGYGEGDEATVVGYGGNAANKYVSTYFRKSFPLDFSGDVYELAINLKRDDGAVVYVNGVEVLRDNIAAGPVLYSTLATAAADDGQDFHAFVVPASSELLVDGTNVVAVEIHQTNVASSDISFDMSLSARRAVRGLLANDRDRAAHPDTPYLVSAPRHGQLTVNADGTFSYTPAANWQGQDSFQYLAADLGGTMLVPPQASWRYLDNGSDQGTAWRESGFDDSSWASGSGQFGYGDGDEATVVGFGPDANNKYVTTYFRQAFTAFDAGAIGPLVLNLIRDDGAIVYLNGVEIARSNLPDGAAFNTLATATVGGAGESQPLQFNVPAGLLVSGPNVLAVEVHQAAGNSSDISFQAWLSEGAVSRPTNVLLDTGPYFDLVVTNTLDAGPGSLRQAIANANAAAGPSTIVFAIPGAGPHVIELASPLPDLVESATLQVPSGTRVEVGGGSPFGFPDFATLVKSGAGTLFFGGGDLRVRGGSLTIQEGMLKLAENGGGLLAVNELAIAPAGQLNLFDNDLVVHATSATRLAVLAAVEGYVTTGAAALTWDGNGIASSAAEADANLLTAVGVMLNDDGLGGAYHDAFGGEPVGRNDILVKYTYYGDADLSGTIDGTDYAVADNGFNALLAGWFNGDFDYSHLVDGTDYALIDNAFNQQGAPLSGLSPGGLAAAAPAVGNVAGALPARLSPADVDRAFGDPGPWSCAGIGSDDGSSLFGRRRLPA